MHSSLVGDDKPHSILRLLGQKFFYPYITGPDDIFSHADGLKEVVGRLMEG